MTLTYSEMLPLGSIAPDFELLDTRSNQMQSLQQLKSPTATVIFFICNHCPYVKHIIDTVVDVAHRYQPKGVRFIAISSNDPHGYPDDAPDKMTEWAKAKNFNFPYLFDATQRVAKAYHAVCTPEFYLVDGALACVYRGRFDAASPGQKDVPVTGEDLTNALDNLLAGDPIDADQKPGMGCGIKWR